MTTAAIAIIEDNRLSTVAARLSERSEEAAANPRLPLPFPKLALSVQLALVRPMRPVVARRCWNCALGRAAPST